jgi:cytochrome c peroxidase
MKIVLCNRQAKADGDNSLKTLRAPRRERQVSCIKGPLLDCGCIRTRRPTRRPRTFDLVVISKRATIPSRDEHDNVKRSGSIACLDARSINLRDPLLRHPLSKFVLISVVLYVVFLSFRKVTRSLPLDDAEIEKLKSFSFGELPPLTQKERELALFGKELFFDTRLSSNGKVACGTCHIPALSFTDGKPVAEGIARVTKNTPPLINVFSGIWFFWDGRADSLEAQSLGPIESIDEHGLDRRQLVETIGKHYREKYVRHFGSWPDISSTAMSSSEAPPDTEIQLDDLSAQAAFESLRDPWRSDISSRAKIQKIAANKVFWDAYARRPGFAVRADKTKNVDVIAANFAVAIAAYERTIVAIDSPFDRFVSRVLTGTKTPKDAFGSGFGPDEWKGYQVFSGEGKCTLCHSGPNFTDQQFHNVGILPAEIPVDLGRATGVLLAKKSAWNCLGGILPRTESESCRDLPVLAPWSIDCLGAC